MKRFLLPILISLFLTLAACGGRQNDAAPASDVPAAVQEEQQTAVPPAADESSEPAEQPVEPEPEPGAALVQQLVQGMTLEQKVGQLFFVHCAASGMEEKITQYHLGGVLLFTRDYKDGNGEWLTKDVVIDKLVNYQRQSGEDTGIPLFIGSDEEGGSVTRASRNPNIFDQKQPSPQALYKIGGLQGLLEKTKQFNRELSTIGINVNFAPVADVSTDPQDFIYDRSFGQGAAETMAYVMGAVTVMRDAGMGSVLKHFPGYGSNVDTHTGIAVDERPMETFRASDFLPFQGGIRAGAPFVLVSHNVVTCMDDTLPASLSPAVHELLRNEMGFDGVILTDDLSMGAVKEYARDGSAAVLALLAGNDMVVTADFESQIPQVYAAVEDGTLDESLIDAAVKRVLTAKYQLGLLGE